MRTLSKPYYRAHRSAAQIERTATVFQRRATIAIPRIELHGVAAHSEDDQILATAVSAGVDYLVTGDIQLLGLGQIGQIPIITPRAFLTVLDAIAENQ